MTGQEQAGVGANCHVAQQRHELPHLRTIILITGKHVGTIIEDNEPWSDVTGGFADASKELGRFYEATTVRCSSTASRPASDNKCSSFRSL
jgi:hypothetical protein